MSDQNEHPDDPGFRIVDKRHGAGEGEQQQPEETESPAPTAEEAAPADAEEQAPLEQVDISGMVEYFISLLGAQAWQWMGLVKNPITGQIERDLDQARVAIDCVEALFKQIEARMPAERARQFRQVLSDLQVNFVHQSGQKS